MNLAEAILDHAKTRPEAPALIEGDRTTSYGQLAALVSRTAGYLSGLAAKRGDRIGLCLRDTSEQLIVLLAVAQIGAVAAPLDWRARAPELSRLVNGMGLVLLLAEPDAQPAVNCPVVRLDAAWHRAVAAAEPIGPVATDWNDAFVVAATSGSTGTPKYPVLTHANYRCRIIGGFELMRLHGRHRFLSTSSLYYSGSRTRCLAHLLRGDCVILYPSLFTPAEYVEAANRFNATIGLVVPSMVRQMLAVAGDRPLLPEMAALFVTGSPLYAEEKRQALRRLTPNFHENYGTTETGILTVLCPGDIAERADSVGRPHSMVELEVVDEEGCPLPVGEVGHLRCRGPALGSPSLDAAEEQARAGYRDGWYYPGETAWLDPLGFLFIDGRVSETIMRSGAKIQPAEVEAALQEHPAVIEAAVTGHRTADNEEHVVAFVVAGAPVQPLDLIAHCRMRLTPHKVPQQIHMVPRLPRSTSGKTDRAELRKWLEPSP